MIVECHVRHILFNGHSSISGGCCDATLLVCRHRKSNASQFNSSQITQGHRPWRQDHHAEGRVRGNVRPLVLSGPRQLLDQSLGVNHSRNAAPRRVVDQIFPSRLLSSERDASVADCWGSLVSKVLWKRDVRNNPIHDHYLCFFHQNPRSDVQPGRHVDLCQISIAINENQTLRHGANAKTKVCNF